MPGRECDLCGLGCGQRPLTQRIAGAERFFCCLGCMNVYVILSESGVLTSGQNLRETELFKRSLELGLISQPESASRPPEKKTAASPASPVAELLLHVTGMWCTSCAWLIERVVATLPGVVSAEVSFASDAAKVTYQPKRLPIDRIIERIKSLGRQLAHLHVRLNRCAVVTGARL